MHQGLLDICECEAGVAYRQYLTRQLAKIQSEEDYIAGDYWKKIIDDTRQWRAEYGAIRVPTAIASGITQ